jgi:hypothetical protein
MFSKVRQMIQDKIHHQFEGSLRVTSLKYNHNLLTQSGCKFFTYVTKTRANLPHTVENRRITTAPFFLRLMSWKTRPQSIKFFVKLYFFTKYLVVSFVLTYSVTLRSWAKSAVSPAEEKCYFGFHSGKKYEF